MIVQSDTSLRDRVQWWLRRACLCFALLSCLMPSGYAEVFTTEQLFDHPLAMIPKARHGFESIDPKKDPKSWLHHFIWYRYALAESSRSDPRVDAKDILESALRIAKEQNLAPESIELERMLYETHPPTKPESFQEKELRYLTWLQAAQKLNMPALAISSGLAELYSNEGQFSRGMNLLQSERARLEKDPQRFVFELLYLKAKIADHLYLEEQTEKMQILEAELVQACQAKMLRRFCLMIMASGSLSRIERDQNPQTMALEKEAQRLVSIAREIEALYEEGYIYYQLGLIYQGRKTHPQALVQMQKAEVIFRQTQSTYWEALAAMEIARSAIATNDWQQALRATLHSKSLLTSDKTWDRHELELFLFKIYSATHEKDKAISTITGYLEQDNIMRKEEKDRQYAQAKVQMGLQIEEFRNQALASENRLKQEKLEAETRLRHMTLGISGGGLVLALSFLSLILMRRHTRKLLEHERQRTLFFHNTSHELRTPLNGMIGFLELIRDGRYGPLTEDSRIQISKVLRLAHALKTQVNAILELARSKKGELSLKPQRISLLELKSELDQLAEGLALKDQKTSYQSEIVLTDETTDFVGDREKLITVARNLLGNAFKFTAPDRPNNVRFSMAFDNGSLSIQVSDDGIGIPKTFQAKIFQEFFQVDGDSRRSYEGTGLGLSLVKTLVQLMGGTIRLDSEPGRGSCFTIVVPSLPEHLVSAQGQQAEKARTEIYQDPEQKPQGQAVLEVSDTTLHHELVLVIDDNEMNCEVMAAILRSDGYRVIHALSGRQGLALMRQQRPHLVLLDLMMPEMSGEEVLKDMRQDPLLEDIPTILVTARASEEDRLHGLRLGANDYLPKPLLTEELKLRVRGILQYRQLTQQIIQFEDQQRLVQLGELFQDLSHELKNLLNTAVFRENYGEIDFGILFAPLEWPPEELLQLIGSLQKTARRLSTADSSESLQVSSEKGFERNQAHLRGQLLELDLESELRQRIWQRILAQEPEVLLYLESLVTLINQITILKHLNQRTRELTHSVLSYTRASNSSGQAQLQVCLSLVQKLLEARTRTLGVTWHLEPEQRLIGMSEGILLQVLMNLISNALDALENLPKNERWIRIETSSEQDKLRLRIINGGLPLPQDLKNKLFKRGFSTKGERGNGVGLYISLRLLQEHAGQLSYDWLSEHPCFELTLPTAAILDSKTELNAS